jgi:hypothetical protein
MYLLIYLFVYLRPYSCMATLDLSYVESHVHNKVNL